MRSRRLLSRKPMLSPSLVVVLAILRLKLLPDRPIARQPSLHPDVRLVLPHAMVRLYHGPGQHAAHLEIPRRECQRMRSGAGARGLSRKALLQQSPMHQNSHFELNSQPPIDRRRHEAYARENPRERAPFDRAVPGPARRRPRRARDLLISHGIVRPHCCCAWRFGVSK